MSTATLLKKILGSVSRRCRPVTPRRGRRESVIEALEGRTLFSLLGVVPGNPGGFVSGPPGSLTYTAATDSFDAVGVPLTFFDAAAVAHNINAPSGFDFHITVDGTGNLTGSGPFAQDISISGSVDTTGDNVADYTGVLLTGKITAFGWDTDGATGYFDARLTVTGGSMSTLFSGGDIGLLLTAEPSNIATIFTGDWTQDFAMQTKGTFGVIPGSGGPQLSISGHKFKDVAGNGLGGGDDTPLQNWTIELYADTNPNGVLDIGDTLIDTTVTAADGSYAFNNLAAGKYFVKEEQRAGWVATGPASGQYTVDLSTLDVTDQNFANFKCICDCDPKPDCTPKPRECGEWQWTCYKGHWGKTWCDTQKNDCAPPTNNNCFPVKWECGTGLFNALKNLFNNWTCDSSKPSNCNCDCDELKTLETAKSSISGSVFHDKDGDGKKDSGESGISGVKITLTGTDLLGNLVSKTAYTDSSGNYKFANLIAGKYTIVECQPGSPWIDSKDYAGTNGGIVSNDKIECITLPPCSDLCKYNFTECKASIICGRVYNDKDCDGKFDCDREKGICNVKVVCSGYDICGNWVSKTCYTDSNGCYSFSGLGCGEYTVQQCASPKDWNCTKNTVGNCGGSYSGNDKICKITVCSDDKGSNYNFGCKSR